MNTHDLEVLTDRASVAQIKGLPFAVETKLADLKVGDVVLDERLGFLKLGVVHRVHAEVQSPYIARVDFTVAACEDGADEADVDVWLISPLASLDERLDLPTPDWQNKRADSHDRTIVLRGVIATEHPAHTWDVDVTANGWHVNGSIASDLAHAFDRTFSIVLDHAQVI